MTPDVEGDATSPASRIRSLFDAAGVRGWLHARPLSGAGDEVDVDADEAVAIASVYKLLLAASWAQLADHDEIDARARIVMSQGRRTPGPTGVSVLLDDVEVSARDAVRLMLTLSDNASADHVLDLVGLDQVEANIRRWGLTRTHVRHGSAASQLQVQRDTATTDALSALDALSDLDREVCTAEYDPARASTSTARDLTTLLSLMWVGDIAPGANGDVVRDAMRQQVFRHRIAAGFPHDDVLVAGKTGSLGLLRHEVGVVEFPGEIPVGVAVLTRAARPERHLPVVDHAIGEVARVAAQRLRRVKVLLDDVGDAGSGRRG